MLVKKVKPPEKTIAQANETVTEVKAAAQHAPAAANAADRGQGRQPESHPLRPVGRVRADWSGP